MSYNDLRATVQEAWEKVGQEKLEELINSMTDRCRAVIEANGLFTRY